MICSLSTKIEPEGLKHIQTLEQELDKTLLAFSCHDLAPADVSAEQLARISALEKQLGIVLLAVKN